jgi:uncharacterized protein GlcG (DUF336 family)
MSVLTLDQARQIAPAHRAGEELSLVLLSVIVLDAGGHVTAFERGDSSDNDERVAVAGVESVCLTAHTG